MSIGNGFFKNIRSVKEDDYDDDDLYDDEELDDDYDDEDDEPVKKNRNKKSLFGRRREEEEDEDDFDDDDFDDEDDYKSSKNSYRPNASYGKNPQPSNVTSVRPRSNGPEVSMIMPQSFDDATNIADILLSHRAVVLNLEGLNIGAAQRLIDYASGACYMVGGAVRKISRRIFILVPQDMILSGDFDDLIGSMIDLNSLGTDK